jgi:EpsI family protein
MVHRWFPRTGLAVIADRRMLLLGAMLFGGAILASAMTPTKKFDQALPPVVLTTLVPEQFADWRVDPDRMSIALPPELDAEQKRVYDQMLVRTYVNHHDERIMLTIAFGDNQSRMLQVHRPEVCYAMLGFEVSEIKKTYLYGVAKLDPIPAMQLIARQNMRNEPVTYWIRIGDQVVRGNVELGLARLGFGLRGYIPDGLLVRVSTITNANEDGFRLERAFITDLLAAMPEQPRVALLGRLGRPLIGSAG